MQFGNKEIFSIETELDENYGGAWLFGKICYWIKGVQVGDYDLGTSLRDTFHSLKWIVYDCGNRAGEGLCKLSPEEIFFILADVPYENNGSIINSNFQIPDTLPRFDISIGVDVFDKWKIYLIECETEAKVIFKTIDQAEINIAVIPIGVFDSAVKNYYNYLDEIYEKERITSV